MNKSIIDITCARITNYRCAKIINFLILFNCLLNLEASDALDLVVIISIRFGSS